LVKKLKIFSGRVFEIFFLELLWIFIRLRNFLIERIEKILQKFLEKKLTGNILNFFESARCVSPDASLCRAKKIEKNILSRFDLPGNLKHSKTRRGAPFGVAGVHREQGQGSQTICFQKSVWVFWSAAAFPPGFFIPENYLFSKKIGNTFT